jgi:hypothetical protein
VLKVIAIDLGTVEYYDSDANEFIYDKGGIVRFEYSLKALYAWEGKWKKSFLKLVENRQITNEELVDFYMTMALDPIHERFMTEDVMLTLSTYIGESHTATTFSTLEDGQNGNNRTRSNKYYTAEELYALMFRDHIPLEFENRNLNRLLIVLRIMASYNAPQKKMTKQDIYRQNAELNRKRREQMKSKG